jgi:SAM-dependent methyltransferase
VGCDDRALVGLNSDGVSFVLDACERGASFTRTLTLGRQGMHMSPEQLERAFERRGRPLTAPEAAALLADGWAESLFEHLGASETASLDASAYEDATILHDLNDPVPEHLHGRFTAVVDGGTIEHVFDVPVALANCARLLEVGGHVLHINPGNNHLGHGFYQFSPDLYWQALPALGFEVLRVLIKEDGSGAWYEVAKPAALGRRVMLDHGRPAHLYALARKVGDTRGRVVQSDYDAAWRAGSPLWSPPRLAPTVRRRIARRLPSQLRTALWRLRRGRRRRDPEAFRRVDL